MCSVVTCSTKALFIWFLNGCYFWSHNIHLFNYYFCFAPRQEALFAQRSADRDAWLVHGEPACWHASWWGAVFRCVVWIVCVYVAVLFTNIYVLLSCVMFLLLSGGIFCFALNVNKLSCLPKWWRVNSHFCLTLYSFVLRFVLGRKQFDECMSITRRTG